MNIMSISRVQRKITQLDIVVKKNEIIRGKIYTLEMQIQKQHMEVEAREMVELTYAIWYLRIQALNYQPSSKPNKSFSLSMTLSRSKILFVFLAW